MTETPAKTDVENGNSSRNIGITLSEHLKKDAIPANLSKLIELISTLSLPISDAFHGKQGVAGTKNIYGEQQVEMDTWADQVICDELRKSNLVKCIASEEQSDIISFEKSEGTFGVVMDPLDGSSLIGVNLSVGTIIGIFDEGNLMEAGKKMDAALYILYGPLTVLVYSAGKGVHEFILDQKNVFRLHKEDLKIPEGNLYAPGAKRIEWTERNRKYVHKLEEDGFKLRYSGAFVADFHQMLHKGGVYIYPATKESESGKLRLIFEANPMSFIVRQAGGLASDGDRPVHTIVPEKLGQRTPLYIGSKNVVELIESTEEI